MRQPGGAAHRPTGRAVGARLGVWREIDEHDGCRHLSAGLAAAMEAGVLDRQPIEPLAHLLMGALGEAGMVIARAGDLPAARAAVGASMDRLVRGLRAGPAAKA